MKYLFPILIFLFVSSSFAETKKAEVETAVKGYIEGFQKRDYNLMREHVTPHFVKVTGGKKAWLKKFETMPSSEVFNAQNIKIISKENKVYVQFDAEEKMAGDSWFRVVFKDKKWQLDEPLNDFDPE